jgi:hypothetical protein
MPYLQNGNARDYLQEHPNADRLQIVRTRNITSHRTPSDTLLAAV